ncbi:hypothetical protein NsoK4_08150 [Nitrosopumilus sp. K4]|uniref:hypothetical protein n=1 Tax=Nitrosopumilus sp. K4 TaxID=2795383 RepID=UPI001BAB8F9D|nr:hypothetical protein [Nitrosopumilus sp. K4]QUC64387.1 hypothetical protein NsoK4_08150 [Nitrosopumilus sp. K4]
MTELKDELSKKWDTKEPVVSLTEDGEPLHAITLHLPNFEIQIKETDFYARKLANILESPRIKKEMGEQLIAMYEHKTGIIFKKTTSWYVTNYRIFCLNEEEAKLTQVPLKYVDVVVSNAHSFSERTGAIAGGMMPGFMYAGMGFTQGQSTSRRVGDINVLLSGQIVILIPDVLDPTGLKQLLYQIKKQIHDE